MGNITQGSKNMENKISRKNEKDVGQISTGRSLFWFLAHIRSGPLILPTTASAVF
jgi:hypothetical protein